MTTARTLISRALRTAGVLGVGQSASAEDVGEGFALVNDMLAQWQARRWLVFHLVDVWCQSTGSQAYTVGPGGDLDMPLRPNRIEGAFFRQGGSPTPHEFSLDGSQTGTDIEDGSNVLAVVGGSATAIDWPLTMLESREDYNAITMKGLPSFPSVAWYDPAMPFGRFYVWALPAAIYELHISVRAPLQSFGNLSDNILLPPEYMEALHYNLAGRLQIAYGMEVNPGIVGIASTALATIRSANAQISLMKMPSAVMGRWPRGVGIGWFGVGGSLPGGGTDTAPSGPVQYFIINGSLLDGGGVYGP